MVTAGSRTVITAVAARPSTVADTVVTPAVSAVTTPVALTDATATALDVNVTVFPTTAELSPNVSSGTSVTVSPVTSALAEILRAMLDTRRAMVSAVVVLTPPTVAEMMAVPALSAVTRPVFDTVATLGAFDTHVAARTLLVPLESVVVACKSRTSPSTKANADGAITTVLTANTTTLATPVLPPTVALIVVVPGDTARTLPSLDTVATEAALEVHAVGSVVVVEPLEFVTAAAIAADSPATSEAFAGVTATEATVAGGAGAAIGSPPPLHAVSCPPARESAVMNRARRVG
nr:hypothetical protein [Gemmatimonas groenlandica]